MFLRDSSKHARSGFPEERRRALVRGPVSGGGCESPPISGRVGRGASNSGFPLPFPQDAQRYHTFSMCGASISGAEFPALQAL